MKKLILILILIPNIAHAEYWNEDCSTDCYGAIKELVRHAKENEDAPDDLRDRSFYVEDEELIEIEAEEQEND